MLGKLIQYSEKNPVFLHALMWTAYFLATILMNLAFSENVQLFGVLIINLLLVAVFYAWVGIFKWFSLGRYWRGIGMMGLLFVIAAGLAYGCLYFLLPSIGISVPNEGVSFGMKEFLKNCSVGFYRMGFYAMLYVLFLRYWESQKELVKTLQQKLEMEKMNVELERKKRLIQEERDAYHARFLTAQIYPHFLRSNLQTLLGRAIYHKDEIMAKTIEYLSEILGYSLKYSREGTSLVYIDEEIVFLKNMVGLIRIGAENNEQAVCYAEKGQVSDNLIPPLTLLTFIENVFKYGEATVQHPLNIQIEEAPRRFVFYCENFKKQNLIVEPGTGIGLNNLEKRLALFFDGQFNLYVNETEDSFTVRLTINYPA